ncbi:MAG: tRNA (N(6)-L-threonylcarbamoyladenosine(37)-C(2))-methylthiotransferase MtaB [Desulfobacteraceae bacterium]|nr:tRNA (N(6)-L-threonylcarbamoyladenosine(37)-C(2))-methylthiotransferase MtaB [Desulfobacteraceae bacterium]
MDSKKTVRAVAVETLGCKVNQYETSYFLQVLRSKGYECVSFRDRADVYIVHSCAVTAKAGYQTRQLLRRAFRLNPDALIVVAGCYAQMDASRIARERLATHILGNPGKFDLLHWLDRPGTLDSPCIATEGATRPHPEFELLPVSRMHTGRTRATLKIQDGCNDFCSYCVVPYVRGRCRSLAAEEVLSQVEGLAGAGYREIVLTGIHLGQWGRDLEREPDLCGLLKMMDSRIHPPRLRLSSLEPVEIRPDLLDAIQSRPWICRHFHIPLQSGDAEILRRMRRPYDPDRYAELIFRIHASLPDAAIGADVMAGFPGETPEQFDNTCRLIEGLPLSYLHVFPFSPRPGTLAATFSDPVQGHELKRRTGILQEIGKRKKRAFRERFIGRSMEVLLETQIQPCLWEGLSENYIPVSVPTAEGNLRADLLHVKITGFRGEDLLAEGVDEAVCR